jgi:hypothetical protein
MGTGGRKSTGAPQQGRHDELITSNHHHRGQGPQALDLMNVLQSGQKYFPKTETFPHWQYQHSLF